MIVDIGHSAKRTDFVFFTEPPPRLASALGVTTPATQAAIAFGCQTPKRVRVRWYYAPEGAKPIPGGSIWGSCDWMSVYERADATIGEVPRTGTSKGNRLGLAPIGVTGQKVCGRPIDFLQPKVWNPAAPIVRRGPTGVPVCCNPGLAASIAFCGRPLTTGALGLYSVLVPDTGELGLTQLDIKTPTGNVGLVAPLTPDYGHLGLTAPIEVDPLGFTDPLEADQGIALDETAVEFIRGGGDCGHAPRLFPDIWYTTEVEPGIDRWYWMAQTDLPWPNPVEVVVTGITGVGGFAMRSGDCVDNEPVDSVTDDGTYVMDPFVGGEAVNLLIVLTNTTLSTIYVTFRIRGLP